MDAQRLEVVLAHRYESDLAVGEKRDLCAVGGVDGITGLAVADRVLDVGDVLHAEERQLFGRHMSNSFALVHRILSTALDVRSWMSARPAWRARGVAGNPATGNFATGNLDGAYPALDLGTDQINVEEPVIQPRAAHFDAFGKDKG